MIAELSFIHRYLPGSANAPTLLLLHGTGGNEADLLPLGRELAPLAPLLSLRGKVLENGMPRFFRRLSEGIFDLDDLQRRTHELADFVAEAADHYGFTRPLALGFSNGANIAASLLLLRPTTLAGAILLRPMVPLVPVQLPDLAGLPVFIGAGQADPIAPPPETKRLAKLLTAAGAEVTLSWQPAGHGLTRGDLETARAWLTNNVKGEI